MTEKERQNRAQTVGNADADGNHGTTSLVRRGGGPRTLAGKQRSRHNAQKHGIFSAVVVLPSESQKEYEAVLEGLRSYFLPVGEIEDLLVEQLATTLWRKRRLLVAETAEICKAQECLEWDREQQQLAEAEEQVRKTIEETGLSSPVLSPKKEGLIWKPQNLMILERCLELLYELRKDFRADGFSSGNAMSILITIYGGAGKHLRATLKDEFAAWAETAEVSEEERAEAGYASPEKCKDEVLEAIDTEIARLKGLKKEHVKMEAQRGEVEKLRLSVPEGPGLDKLLRYEAALDRSFDRTLGQLERLQRMRLGQPVPPQLKLEVTKN